MLIFLSVFGVFGLMVLSAVWKGFVLSVMWGWFVVPYFQLPPLTIPLAIGISMIASMLTWHRTGSEAQNDKSASEQFTTAAALSLFLPAFMLLSGWIVTKFL